jgi:hypothetical protein
MVPASGVLLLALMAGSMSIMTDRSPVQDLNPRWSAAT